MTEDKVTFKKKPILMFLRNNIGHNGTIIMINRQVSEFMLIEPDKFRKVLILIFSCLFLILAIQVRFNLLFMHVLDDGAELAVRHLLPQTVQSWVSLAGICNHYWLAALFTVGLACLLYWVNYKIAMGWLLVTQLLALFVAAVVTVLLQLQWHNGVHLGPMVPDLLSSWWLQILAVLFVIFLPRLMTQLKWRLVVQGCIILFWCLLALARMQQNHLSLSSELGALLFGYFWWQLSEQQYRKHAKHWREVLKIDTSI